MVAALIHGGLGLGPAMAFLVTGGFIIALVVALLFAGARSSAGSPAPSSAEHAPRPAPRAPAMSRGVLRTSPAPGRSGRTLVLRA